MHMKDRFIAWLRDAHAMEEQALTMLTAQANRIQSYPELKARIERHVLETQEHLRLLQELLDTLRSVNGGVKAGHVAEQKSATMAPA